MKRQSILVFGVCLSMMSATLVFTGAAGSSEWPTRWTVNGNGVTGILEFSIHEDGSLVGRLLDAPTEGYVSGRHLFIGRTVDNRVEVWEGWLGQPRPGGEHEGTAGSNLILAGTISVDDAGETRIYPWFGTPVADEATAAAESAPTAPVSSSVAASAASPAMSPGASEDSTTAAGTSTDPVPAQVPAVRPGGPLSGFWSTAQGRVEVVQDGEQLTAIFPDGSSRSGRMTGGDTLVVGLGKGCCNGKLEGSDIINWIDGTRWKRTD